MRFFLGTRVQETPTARRGATAGKTTSPKAATSTRPTARARYGTYSAPGRRYTTKRIRAFRTANNTDKTTATPSGTPRARRRGGANKWTDGGGLSTRALGGRAFTAGGHSFFSWTKNSSSAPGA